MDALFRRVVLAQIIGRNAVPLVGILFSGWSPANVVLLYFCDTLLSIGVVSAGAQSVLTMKDSPALSAVASQVRSLGKAAFVCAVFAIPLGMPVGIVLATSGFSFSEALRDRSLGIGILVQCAIAAWSYLALYRALRTHAPAELRLKQRFALIVMRWAAVLAMCYFLLQFGSGWVVLVLLVVTYVSASIVAEIAPDLVLRGIAADEPEPLTRAARDVKASGDRRNHGP